MKAAVYSPIALFRFAVHDADWPLAATLAHAMSDSRTARRGLEAALAASDRLETPSLLGLRTLALVLRSLARGRGQR